MKIQRIVFEDGRRGTQMVDEEGQLVEVVFVAK